MTVQTQVRIDVETKKKACELFAKLGLDMSSAINMFLHQCILKGGIPFSIELPPYNQKTLDAMEEGYKVATNPNYKVYSTAEELFKALDDKTSD